MRRFLTSFAAACMLFCMTPAGAADTFPTHSIVLISWAAAGSPGDVTAREIAQLAPKYLGVNMIVENKIGADGGNAMSYLLSQPADGYTLLAQSSTFTVVLNTSLKENFKPDQFAYLGTLVTDPYVIAVRSESPIKTWNDLIAAAKASPNFTIGGSFAQSSESFFARDVADAAKIKFSWVAFSGGSSANAAVLGGHIDAVCTNVSAVAEYVKGGQMRALAFSGTRPIPELPGTPTFASFGYKTLVGSHWRGVLSRGGLPDAVAARLQNFLKQVSSDPEFTAYVASSGLVPYYRDSAGFQKVVGDEMVSVAQQLAKTPTK